MGSGLGFGLGLGSGLGLGFGFGLGSGLEPNLGAVAVDLLRVLEQEVEEHQRHDEGREEQVEDARQHEATAQPRDVLREGLPDAEVLVEHRVKDALVQVRVRVRVRVRVS